MCTCYVRVNQTMIAIKCRCDWHIFIRSGWGVPEFCLYERLSLILP